MLKNNFSHLAKAMQGVIKLLQISTLSFTPFMHAYIKGLLTYLLTSTSYLKKGSHHAYM